MTRVAFLEVWTAAQRKSALSVTKNLFDDDVAHERFVTMVEEAVAKELGLYGPARTDDRYRDKRLKDLERSATKFLMAVNAIDTDTAAYVRQQPMKQIDISSAPDFDLLMHSLSSGAVVLLDLTKAAIERRAARGKTAAKTKKRAQKNSVTARSLLSDILQAYSTVVGLPPAVDKASAFFGSLNELLELLGFPTVAASTLEDVRSDLVAAGEMRSRRSPS
jgi:hypothetical protein